MPLPIPPSPKRVWIYFLIAISFFIFVTLWVVLSATLDLNNAVCGTSMFQRSGAVLVLATIVLQASLNVWIPNGGGGGYPFNHPGSGVINSFSSSYFLHLIHHVRSAVWITSGLGTAIWAYGDFLFKAAPC